jgi:hypothetical protein
MERNNDRLASLHFHTRFCQGSARACVDQGDNKQLFDLRVPDH